MKNLLNHRVSGRALNLLLRSQSAKPARMALAFAMRQQLGIAELDKLPMESREALPVTVLPKARNKARALRKGEPFAPSSPSEWPRTQAFVHDLYTKHARSPEQVAKALFEEIDALDGEIPSANPFLSVDEAGVLAEAKASTERWRNNQPLGPFDGVPIAIKEQSDVSSLRTRLGTNWIETTPATEDATVVKRLRAQGALIVGHTVMTEFGMSPLGVNPQRRMPSNVHHSKHMAGGSSTGSATAVALGLCPVALGADGGGSIRIPAALNGVFGIKPTFGRIPRTGDRFDGSMNHLGPIGVSSYELALFLEAVAGDDGIDPASRGIAAYSANELLADMAQGIKGFRIGVDETLWALADPAIVSAANLALQALEDEGAEIVSISLPLAHHASAIGYLTLAPEAYASFRRLKTKANEEYGPDVRLMRAFVSEIGPDEYLAAQQLRATLRKQTSELFDQVDLIALPSTACLAPRFSNIEEMVEGVLDPESLDALCRYAFLANITGLPAGTAPIGRNADGLPFALQLMADAWDEGAVLSAMAALERTGISRSEKPARCF
ncbi:MAG: amidase [Myxococcales bacterium]|nr:MAG: amidase [Myxococcales bacterium]